MEENQQQTSEAPDFYDSLKSYVDEHYVNGQSNLSAAEPEEDRQEPAVDEDQADQEAKSDDEQSPDDDLVTVKIDGEERQVSKADLIASFQKNMSAEQRFSEAANLRKEVEAERTKIAQERDKALSVMEAYTKQLQSLMDSSQPNWEELIANDPQEYIRQKHLFEQKQFQLYEAQQAQSKLEQEKQNEVAQMRAEYVREQSDLLLKAIPEWADESKSKTEQQELVQYLRKAGYEDSVLSNIVDHREVVLARKAMLYDKMISQKSEVKSKIQNLPPVRVESASGKKSSNGSQFDRHMSSLRKTGSIHDAALALTARLQGN